MSQGITTSNPDKITIRADRKFFAELLEAINDLIRDSRNESIVTINLGETTLHLIDTEKLHR